MKLLAITILHLLFLTHISVYSQNYSAEQMQKGLQLLKTENFDEAIREFTLVLNSEPENFQARLGLAISLIGLEKFAEASREIAKLLARDPKNPQLLEMAAQVFWRQKRYIETETVLKRRLDLGNQTAELWALFGDALDAQKKTIEAVSAYKKAIELKTDSIDFRYALGSLYWKLVLFEESEREFLEILRIQPGEPRASFNLGDIYLSRGDAGKAVPFLEVSAKAFPKEYDPQFALGRAFLLLKDYSKAINYLETAVKLRPEIAEGFYQLGLALRRSGKVKESQIAFEKAKQLQKNKLDAEKKLYPDQ